MKNWNMFPVLMKVKGATDNEHKETYCEIEVNVQNPEKRPIPRNFRLNESMDVNLNNKTFL